MTQNNKDNLQNEWRAILMDLSNKQELVKPEDIKFALEMLASAMQRSLPKEHSIDLIQMNLQQGKPQMAANRSGYNSALKELSDILNFEDIDGLDYDEHRDNELSLEDLKE